MESSSGSSTADISPEWSVEETKHLIRLRVEMDETFNKVQHLNFPLMHIWQQISTNLNNLPHIVRCQRTAAMCYLQWQNILNTYYKMKIQRTPILDYFQPLEAINVLGVNLDIAPPTNNNIITSPPSPPSVNSNAFQNTSQIATHATSARNQLQPFPTSNGIGPSCYSVPVMNSNAISSGPLFATQGNTNIHEINPWNIKPRPLPPESFANMGHNKIMIPSAYPQRHEFLQPTTPVPTFNQVSNTAGSYSLCDESVPPNERYIIVTHGSIAKRFGLEGSAESIGECIKLFFGLRGVNSVQQIWVVDSVGHARQIDRNLPVNTTYTIMLASPPPTSEPQNTQTKVRSGCVEDQSSQV